MQLKPQGEVAEAPSAPTTIVRCRPRPTPALELEPLRAAHVYVAQALSSHVDPTFDGRVDREDPHRRQFTSRVRCGLQFRLVLGAPAPEHVLSLPAVAFASPGGTTVRPPDVCTRRLNTQRNLRVAPPIAPYRVIEPLIEHLADVAGPKATR